MKIKFNVRAMQKHGPACWNGQVVKKKKNNSHSKKLSITELVFRVA